MDPVGPKRRVCWITIATALTFALFWTVVGAATSPSAPDSDFVNLYSGARLALEGSWSTIHDPSVQLATEQRYAPDLTVLRPYVRPHFHALLMMPLTLLPFDAAFLVWLIVWTLLYGAICWWAARTWNSDFLILGSMYLPAALGIAQGQDCVWMLLVLCGSYALNRRNQAFWGGVVLSLGLMKFHLMLWFPPLLLLSRRWRLLGGFCLGGVSEIVLSWMLAGTTGFRRYFDLLTSDQPLLEPSKELHLNIVALSINLQMETFAAPATIATAILVLVAAWRAPEWRIYTVAAAGALSSVPHTYGYDATFLLLGLWLTMAHAQYRVTKGVAATLCTPIPFAFALGGCPWAAVGPATMLAFVTLLAIENYRSILKPAVAKVADVPMGAT